VWRETPFFTPRERAALAWTEAVTEVGRTGVPDDVYAALGEHFSEAEIVDLTMAVIAINGWNRLAVSFRTLPGSYVPRGA
jgi:alkylhydroperoxidase family enzyme